nr:two-component sensor kinase [Rhodomonas sp. NIES-1006]
MLKIQKLRQKPDGYKEGKILIDKNLVIVLINQRALKILKLKKNRVIGTNILLYLPTEIRTKLASSINLLLTKINNRQIRECTLMLDHRFDLKITMLCSRDESIKNLEFININIIPTNKTVENSLKFPTTHINTLSHELRAPLFNIQSFLETLYEYNEQLNVEQRLEFLEIATNETNRLNNLVKNILDFAELEEQKNNIFIQCSVIRIIEEIIQLNQLTAINKGLLLKTNNQHNHKKTNLLISRSSLVRVLSNLVNNSIKFTYPKGIINVQTQKLDSYCLKTNTKKTNIRFSIIDTGIGVSKQDKKNIFNRFSRGSKKTRIIVGSGLGLPIVKEILFQYQQKLNFSSSVNKGSSVSFNFGE